MQHLNPQSKVRGKILSSKALGNVKGLYCRAGRYFVRATIPPDCRVAFGKHPDRVSFLTVNLDTSDRAEAKLRAPVEFAKLKAMIRLARKQPGRIELERAYSSIGSLAPHALERLAATLDKDMEGERDMPLLPHHGDKGLGLIACDFLKDLGIESPSDEQILRARGWVLQNDRLAVALRRANAALPPAPEDTGEAASNASKPLIVALDEWVDALDVTEKTRQQRRKAIMRFSKDFRLIGDVSRAAVQAWMDGLGLAPGSLKRLKADIRGYWEHLERKGLAREEVQPFHKLSIPKPKNGKRKAFTPEEVTRIMNAAAAGKDQVLADLIQIAAFTGMRREEICSLKRENINLKAGVIKIDGGKSEAAEREIPIHSALRPTLQRLAASAPGYVLAGTQRGSVRRPRR